MINMARFTQAQADNTCVLNGVEFTCTDAVAQKVLDLLTGANAIESVAQAEPEPTQAQTPAPKKASTMPRKDVPVVWNIEKAYKPNTKRASVFTLKAYRSDNGKPLYYKTIASHITRALVKALEVGEPMQVGFEANASKLYRMKTFATKADAEKAISLLPTCITAEMQDAYISNGYSL